MDLRSEQDIEQLRRVALAQQIQIEQLLKILREKHVGEDLQQKLVLLEDMTRQQEHLVAKVEELEKVATTGKKKREQTGSTPQPKLPVVEEIFGLDAADKTCPSCGGTLAPMKEQFETSEMVDVVEVSYRVVKVKQQKYVCKYGGCFDTAPGPSARRRAVAIRSPSPSRSPSTSISITSRSRGRSASFSGTISS